MNKKVRRKNDEKKERLKRIYEILQEHYGNLEWWPGETPFEIIVGAVLTQNTAWENAARAIEVIKSEGKLTFNELWQTGEEELQRLIRASGCFRVKTKRLRALMEMIMRDYNGSVEAMLSDDAKGLRTKLIDVNGIGKETADCILLYAGRKPIFVIDAYTRRILTRHEVIDETLSYDEVQALCMEAIEPEETLYNQYHALLVTVGKGFCRTKPRCEKCPLGDEKT